MPANNATRVEGSDVVDYDIVIVGAGLVGATLAQALRGSTLRVALVEPRAVSRPGRARDDNRAIVLTYGSRRILDGLGLWGRIAPDATPIRRIHISDRGHFGAMRIDSAEAAVEALGYVVPYAALDDAVIEAAVKIDNVRVLSPATVVGIECATSHASLLVDMEDRQIRLSTKLVVAADGNQSTVRRLAGIQVEHRAYDQGAVTTKVALSQPHDNTAHERFVGDGALALLPFNDKWSGLIWTVRTQDVPRILGLSDRAFLAEAQSLVGYRLGRFEAVGARRAHPLASIHAQEIVRPRLVLVGNAAHSLHPVGAQGFNLGLRDVAALADAVIDSLSVGGDPGAWEVLSAYAQHRRSDHRRTRNFTDGLVRLFSTDSPPIASLRGPALLLLDRIPFAKHLLTRAAMGLSGPASRLARGLLP